MYGCIIIHVLKTLNQQLLNLDYSVRIMIWIPESVDTGSLIWPMDSANLEPNICKILLNIYVHGIRSVFKFWLHFSSTKWSKVATILCTAFLISCCVSYCEYHFIHLEQSLSTFAHSANVLSWPTTAARNSSIQRFIQRKIKMN